MSLFLTWIEQICTNNVHMLLFLTWIQQIFTNDVHVIVSDLDTTDLYQWRTYVVSDLDTVDLLPMRYIFCCCFWLVYNISITNEVQFLLLFLTWIQGICYQWGKKKEELFLIDIFLLFLMDWSSCACTASSVQISEVKFFQHCCHCWNLPY